jgi:hypothetical protein
MAAVFITLPLCARADEVLLPGVVDGKWGFVDTTGKVVIAPRLGAAGCFSRGLVAVREKSEWSFIYRNVLTCSRWVATARCISPMARTCLLRSRRLPRRSLRRDRSQRQVGLATA